MIQLSNEQLNNLVKEALIVIVSSLQDQFLALQSQLDHANAQFSDNNRQIELLTEQIRTMNQRFFGSKSEAAVSDIDDQISPFDSFNEAEYLNQDSLKEPEITEVIVPSYHRKKSDGKRESDLAGLPARIIKHTLSDEKLAVKFPDGYKKLPEEVYKCLHIIPETFIVNEHHVHVYASKSNDGTILKVPRPKDLFRNSIATPALVASIINGKYTSALPLKRQSKAFKINGIQLSTNTMANWVIKSTDVYLSLIYDRLHELIYDSKVIHADESSVKVMRIDHAKIKKRQENLHVGLSKPATAKGSIAQEAYGMITEIMYLDNTFDDLFVTDRKKQRQLVLLEKVDAYFAWAKQKYSQLTHNSTIGKALAYSINQEEYLRVFLSDGNVPMDNNYAEQAIRPFTIGRKNFLMIESSNGAKASAILYSLIETAKANMLNTFEYFNLLLTEIPQHMADKDLRFIDNLLPWSPRIQKECPSRYKKSRFFNVHIYFNKVSSIPARMREFLIPGTHV